MTTTTRIRACGESALLLECADLAEAVALAAMLEHLRPEAVDVVAAARTVLVTAEGPSALPALRRRVEALLAREPAERSGEGAVEGDRAVDRAVDRAAGREAGQAAGREVTLDVRYDGPDLADVADLAGVSPQALVRQHTAITWRAAFGGFAPGFFYLVDERELLGERGGGQRGPAGERELGLAGDRGLGRVAEPVPLPSVPRLGSPRARVPAGSVGLADRFCAVYPGPSPGGWRLLGTTDAVLWDLERPAPALLEPGVTVRFRDVDAREGAR